MRSQRVWLGFRINMLLNLRFLEAGFRFGLVETLYALPCVINHHSTRLSFPLRLPTEKQRDLGSMWDFSEYRSEIPCGGRWVTPDVPHQRESFRIDGTIHI